MESNEMISKPLEKVFQELAGERQNLEYFKELDREWLFQTVQLVIKNAERMYA